MGSERPGYPAQPPRLPRHAFISPTKGDEIKVGSLGSLPRLPAAATRGTALGPLATRSVHCPDGVVEAPPTRDPVWRPDRHILALSRASLRDHHRQRIPSVSRLR